MTENIPHRVKELRQQKGYTQDQLAKSLNISIFHMNRIENRRRSLTTTLAARIAKELDVSIGDIFLD